MNLSSISSDTIVLLIGLLAGFIFNTFLKGFRQCPLHQAMHDDVMKLDTLLKSLLERLDEIKDDFNSSEGVWVRIRKVEDRLTKLERN